jgi:hypothetical protein
VVALTKEVIGREVEVAPVAALIRARQTRMKPRAAAPAAGAAPRDATSITGAVGTHIGGAVTGTVGEETAERT